MSDLMSILQSNYLAVGSTTYSNSKYVDVNAADYQGSWTGQYGNGKDFTVQVSNVQGFRATVRYQSEGTVNYGQVLIKDASFRIGDTKFLLQQPQSGGQGAGTAQIATAITDPVTGDVSLQQAYATQG